MYALLVYEIIICNFFFNITSSPYQFIQVVVEVPEETCNLEPQKECKHVTKLVPHLKSKENCIDIPKEVCSRSRTNPRKVDKPIVKKWCYESLGPRTTRRP